MSDGRHKLLDALLRDSAASAREPVRAAALAALRARRAAARRLMHELLADERYLAAKEATRNACLNEFRRVRSASYRTTKEEIRHAARESLLERDHALPHFAPWLKLAAGFVLLAAILLPMLHRRSGTSPQSPLPSPVAVPPAHPAPAVTVNPVAAATPHLLTSRPMPPLAPPAVFRTTQYKISYVPSAGHKLRLAQLPNKTPVYVDNYTMLEIIGRDNAKIVATAPPHEPRPRRDLVFASADNEANYFSRGIAVRTRRR